MSVYKNSAAYTTGGRIYSNGNVLATNKSQSANYFPNPNGTLETIKARDAILASFNDNTSATSTCYNPVGAFSIDFIP
jgi:hypothetical protein